LPVRWTMPTFEIAKSSFAFAASFCISLRAISS